MDTMNEEETEIAVAMYSPLVQFFREKKYCDVRIRVDNKSIKSHILLLRAVSEYFDDLLGDNFEEGNKPAVITIPPEAKINAAAFQEFLEYVYSGCISVTESNKHALSHISEILRLRFTFVPEEGYHNNRREHWAMMYKLLIGTKHFDITIYLQDDDFVDGGFKCHRLLLAAASIYIDDKMKNVFNSIENIVKMRPKMKKAAKFLELSNTYFPARTFEVIWEFIYSCKVQIPEARYRRFDLLFACRFLRLRTTFIQKKCFESLPLYICKQIEKTHLLVPYALEIFSMARKMNQTPIANHFLGPHICKHLFHYSKNLVFFELTFDDLLVILEKLDLCLSSVCVIFRIVVHWISHDRSKREKYFNALVSKIVDTEAYLPFRYEEFIREYRSLISSDEPSENVIGDGISIMDKIMSDMDERSELAGGRKCSDAVGAKKLAEFFRFGGPIVAPAVHVYVRYADTGRVGVFSTNETMDNYWVNTYEFHSGIYSTMRSIALGDFVYRLRSDFQLQQEPKNPHRLERFPAFSACKSVYYFPGEYLKEPPRLLGNFDMCGAQNMIFVYNGTPTVYAPHIISQNQLMEPGSIYRYNCELDMWLPVPPPKEKVTNACMTMDQNSLYLIGGDKSYVQAYDWRTFKWRYLIRPARQYVKYEACVHRNKIYVGGVLDTDFGLTSDAHYSLDAYDPVAGKWKMSLPEGLQGTSYSRPMYHNEGLRLLSYANELWMIRIGDQCKAGMVIYNDNADTTRESLSILDIFEETPPETKSVVDAFVF